MSMSDNDLKPEEFAQAAAEAITDAQTRGFREAAQVLANAGLCGVCAQEDAGGLALGIEFALPIVAEAGKLRLQWPLLETILIAKALGDSALAAELASGARVATWALQGSLQDGFAGQARYATDSDWVLVADGQGGGALLDLGSVEIQDDGALDPEHPQSWMTLDSARVLAELDAATFAALQRDSQILIAGLRQRCRRSGPGHHGRLHGDPRAIRAPPVGQASRAPPAGPDAPVAGSLQRGHPARAQYQ